LELPDLTTLAVDLNAHTLDLASNVFDMRHGSALWNYICVYRKPYPGLLSEESADLAR